MAQHPEALLISAIVKTGEYQALAKHGISSAMFHAYQEEARWLENYIARTGKTPSRTAFRNEFTDFTFYKVDDVEHWCEEVRKEHVQVAITSLFDQGLDLIDADDIETTLQKTMAGLMQIQAQNRGINPDFDVFDQWQEVYDSVSDRCDRVRTTGYAGVPTGFTTLDLETGGLQAGWFCVVAARLGVGKTWTGIKMGWSAASTQHKVTYFSLEQSRLQISTRVHAFGSRQYSKTVFNPRDLNRGQGFNLIEYKTFLKDLQTKKGNGAFYINDTSRGLVTPSTIAAAIEDKQPDIVIIDYLTLLGTDTDDWKGTAKVSNQLQGVAQRYNIPIVALSQVNRLGGGLEPPGAEHLSQADAIGQDADLVLTMAQRSTSIMKMKLAKFRHGSGGATWFARFSPGTGEYEEVSVADAEAAIEADNEDD